MANATLTRHAEIRFKQRGIRDEVMDCLERYGQIYDQSGGATRIFLPRHGARRAIKDLKRMIRAMESARGITVICNGETILTAYRDK